MGSLHANSDARWDHEPRAWSADLQVGAIGARLTAPSWSSALRFMGKTERVRIVPVAFDAHDYPGKRPAVCAPYQVRGRGAAFVCSACYVGQTFLSAGSGDF